MNSKTVVTAIVGAIAGLSLAVGTVAFAHNTDHMGNIQGDTMMGQTFKPDSNSQNTHGHHTGSQATGNYPCHANTGVKSAPKT